MILSYKHISQNDLEHRHVVDILSESPKISLVSINSPHFPLRNLFSFYMSKLHVTKMYDMIFFPLWLHGAWLFSTTLLEYLFMLKLTFSYQKIKSSDYLKINLKYNITK